MDFTLSLSSDWFNLLSLPLIFLTIKAVIPKWQSIWDANLSQEDRRLIMRMVIFLALPVIVLIHELGHLLAAVYCGARVLDFHYGPVAGHVTVDAHLAADKLLYIAVAGNLAQVLVGAVALSLSTIVRSAPLVTFLVYLGLFSIGDTVIFYAALSLASIYGDWIQIYQSPCTSLVYAVGAIHALLVIFVVYCLKSKKAHLWFTKKTLPDWTEANNRLCDLVKNNPGIENYIALINSFMEAGLSAEADKYIRRAEILESNNPAIAYIKAELEMARGNLDKARQIFQKLADHEKITDEMRAGIVLNIGDLWLYKRDTQKALQCFELAGSLDRQLGDARLHKAMLKANTKDYADMQEDLQILKSNSTHWLYRHNQESAAKEIEKLELLNGQINKGK